MVDFRLKLGSQRNCGLGTKLSEELKSYLSRMSRETFELENNVCEDDQFIRCICEMCKLRCEVYVFFFEEMM